MQIVPHDKQEWLGAFFRMLILLVVFAEGYWFITPGWPPTGRYRYQERHKALADWATQQTAETKASLDAERHLLSIHQNNSALFVLALFMCADGVMVYFLWNYGQKKQSA